MTNIVFFGTGSVAAQSLESIANDFTVEAVITKSMPPHHRGIAPVEELAKNRGIPVYYANTRRSLDELFDEHAFQSQIGIIVDHGVIVSQKVIDAFKYGIINSHFSLLPEWRGADPITFSLLSGQQKTGVSLMVIDAGLDTGKLITQKSLPVDSDDTASTLTSKLVSLSNTLLREYIPRYVNGEIKPRHQPHPDRATYSTKLSKEDGVIDWTKPAVQLECEIRAYKGWPQSRTSLSGIDLIITKASVIEPSNAKPGEIKLEKNRLFIGTGSGLLEIHSLKPLGKKEMPVSAFLAGYRSKLKV